MFRLSAVALFTLVCVTASTSAQDKPKISDYAGKWKSGKDTLSLDEEGKGKLNLALVRGKEVIVVIENVNVKIEGKRAVFSFAVVQDDMKWALTLGKDKKTMVMEQVKGMVKRPKLTFKLDE